MARNLQQTKVANRLAMAGKKLMRDRIELPAARMMVERWEQVRDEIIAHARGVWEREHGAESPLHAQVARDKIATFMDEHLKRFRNETVEILNTAKVQAYEQQYLIDNWVLDQVTPPNVTVKPKRNPAQYQPAGGFHHKIGLKEAWWEEPPEGTPNTDPDTGAPVASGEQRVDGYLKAWEAVALAGVGLGALQGDSPEDIDARVSGATAAGVNVQAAIDRIIKTEVQISVADADESFMEDFEELLKRDESVWVTMDDERVCDICRSQEGKTQDEAEYTMPAHPKCRCWWRVKALDYKQLAGALSVPGVSPESMIFRDPQTGKARGAVVVNFDAWAQSIR